MIFSNRFVHVLRNDLLPLLTLAVPLILTGLVQSSLGFFESIFISHLGENALAAGALVNWLFITLIVILFGTFSSVNILIAHKYGANDQAGIILVLRDGLLLALFLTIPTFILFWYVPAIYFLLGQSAELVALAKLYLHGLAWGLLPKFILIVLFEFLLGLGHSRTLMIINVLSIPVYIFFSFALIFGKFGMPALGIAGAGWGLSVSDWLFAFILCIYLFNSKNYKPYMLAIFSKKKLCHIWEILRLGLPMGIMYCIEVGFFFAVTILMGIISIPSLAANQVTMQYVGPLMSAIFCTAQAITIRMGHQIGANQMELAKRTAYVGMMLSAIYVVIIAIIYWLMPRLLISVDFDVNNPNLSATVNLACEFFSIAAFFQILDGIRISLFGALRALKDTQFTLLSSIISFWCIALPFGYVLATYFHFQGAGLWWGMVLGAAFSVLFLYWRFKSRINHYLVYHASRNG
jgi:multidrug resistance protein, MATE family